MICFCFFSIISYSTEGYCFIYFFKSLFHQVLNHLFSNISVWKIGGRKKKKTTDLAAESRVKIISFKCITSENRVYKRPLTVRNSVSNSYLTICKSNTKT